ncbi:DEAD/DEAH box helicase [Candidatus Pelagibacter bacterium]|nr:DEAD/DEAH box helicase [Candidatus Pelagibacter bacterium]
MENFKLLKIEDSLKNSLQKMNFTKPTPIQAMAIPVALEGKDVLGTAQTGTGKTLAFSIPLINKLILDKNAFALVMCPTRELATQVMAAIKSIISDKINIRTALLIGGEAMQKQLRQLSNRSRIIVGTPGRINDHLKRKSLNLSATKYLVLDETDRMLDMGFTPQIEMILKFVPKNHQTLLFSATLPQNILRISERYLTKPERISTGSTSIPIAKIKQETLQVFKENKYDELIDQFLSRKGSILVFVKTKRGADKMVKRLKEEGHSADAIHGDLRQSKRDRVIASFRKGIKRILIATDVAARGLDIPLIQHVINYDLPQVPEDYVHRIGRTARAGSEGSALTFLTPDDRSMWNSISKLIDPNFKPAPGKSRNNYQGKKRGKAPYNKKRKFKDEKRSSFGDKKKFFKKDDSRKSSFGDKKKFFKKDDSRKSSFGDKKKFFKKDDSRKSSFGDKKKFFKKDDSRKSSFGDKKKFFKKDDSRKSSFGDQSKPSGFTNNPKYFGKEISDNSTVNLDKDGFRFKRKKKFKSRNSRPKNFTFKKHSQKRAKI